MSLNVSPIGLNSVSTCIIWVWNTAWLYTLNVLSNDLFRIRIFLYVISWIVMNLIVLDMVMINIHPCIYMISRKLSIVWCVSFNSFVTLRSKKQGGEEVWLKFQSLPEIMPPLIHQQKFQLLRHVGKVMREMDIICSMLIKNTNSRIIARIEDPRRIIKAIIK